jgi:hypothetical protein
LDNTDLQRSGFAFGNWSWNDEIYEADDIIIMTENVPLSAVWISTGGGGGPGFGNATVVNPISPQPPIEPGPSPDPDEGYGNETAPPLIPEESRSLWWLVILGLLAVGIFVFIFAYKRWNASK